MPFTPWGKSRRLLQTTSVLLKWLPRMPDLKRKLAECEKEVKRLRFEEALSVPVSCDTLAKAAHIFWTLCLKVDVTSVELLSLHPIPRLSFFTGCIFLAVFSTFEASDNCVRVPPLWVLGRRSACNCRFGCCCSY